MPRLSPVDSVKEAFVAYIEPFGRLLAIAHGFSQCFMNQFIRI